MVHRHITTGEIVSQFFVSRVNRDLTEGRGPMVDNGIFTSHMDAYQASKGQGVQGVGDGDVVIRTFRRCEDGCPAILEFNDSIYHGSGWSKKQAGKLGYEQFAPDGWRVDYSPMTNDPDYKEFLRLRKVLQDKGIEV